ncbi:MAG: dihydropteroate synthase [Succiniclasticum sp.]|nr:dihydropteroate synthase [Succiniclasticum sp.]MDY6303109.1 dihydropteroate synthase [Succiniclasticum sp.]
MLYEVNPDALKGEITRLGVYRPSVSILADKGRVLALKVTDVRTPAANIIKQEMLAAGGDCATPGTAITCAVPRVDIILLGGRKQYDILLYKMRQMPYFGIPAVVAELERYLRKGPKGTLLADGRRLTYDRMAVMGILNVTPDSFYAGSRRQGTDAVLAQAERMLADGAAILDIGGESTRPGADPVTAEEERARVLPAVEQVKRRFPEAVVSVDTYRASLAREALAVGADIINDISAMQADPGMLQAVVDTGAPIILMHMRGVPKNMQTQCQYDNVVQEVAASLDERARLLRDRGIGPDKIILDPGIGFAKDTPQNLALIQGLNALTGSEYPVLMAASRKTVIGQVLGGLPPEERLEGTLAISAASVYAGAELVRVHDVRENVRLIRMLEAIRRAGQEGES